MDIREIAQATGFADCYILSTEPFVHYAERLEHDALHSAARELTIDIQKDAPWANAVVAMIMPYRPYTDEIPVSGNYPSSNAAYHAAGAVIKTLNTQGIRAERADLPLRELLTRNGIGNMLKNGLTYIPGFGTRYSVSAILAQIPDVQYTPARKPTEVKCEQCHACEKICPSGAIGSNGYDFRKCARAYMGGDPMEPWVMDAMTCILGCELCQKICPYNMGIESITEMPEAFRLEELLKGNVKPVLAIVGKNLNKNGRIIQHACVVAAHQDRRDLIPLIEPLLADHREGVRVAAQYALNHLRA